MVWLHLACGVLVSTSGGEGQRFLVDGGGEGSEDPHRKQLNAVPVPVRGDVQVDIGEDLVSKNPSPREEEDDKNLVSKKLLPSEMRTRVTAYSQPFHASCCSSTNAMKRLITYEFN